MLTAWLAAAAVSYAHARLPGVAVAALALVVCWAAAAAALAVTQRFRSPALALHAMLLSMAVRTGGPLCFLAMIHLHGWWGEPELVCACMFFYLVGLAVEVPLSLHWIERHPPASAMGCQERTDFRCTTKQERNEFRPASGQEGV